ncbi:MAG: hypothetical protein R3F37_09720 [Candidatus Competibacteraceae bacterium]
MINNTQSQQSALDGQCAASHGSAVRKKPESNGLTQKMSLLTVVTPEGSQQVYALGMLPDKGDEMVLPVARDKRTMMPGQLMVTVEKVGDSMPAQPSGPIEYKGKWMPVKI